MRRGTLWDIADTEVGKNKTKQQQNIGKKVSGIAHKGESEGTNATH